MSMQTRGHDGCPLQERIFQLERELADEQAIVNKVWATLGISCYEDAKGKTIWELVADLRKQLEPMECGHPRACWATYNFEPYDHCRACAELAAKVKAAEQAMLEKISQSVNSKGDK